MKRIRFDRKDKQSNVDLSIKDDLKSEFEDFLIDILMNEYFKFEENEDDK